MKNYIIISVAFILVVFIGLLLLNMSTNRSIKTEILIEASAEEAWKVLMDHKSYSEWNPFIKQISGSPEVGKHIDVIIQAEGSNPMKFQPEILTNNKSQEFRWVGKLGVKGVFDGEHYFILEEKGNQTKFIHGENFSGILSGLLLKMIKTDTENGFNAMNKALKARVESTPIS